MAPADEALHADDAFVTDCQHRLVVEIDFAALQGQRQLAGQLQLVVAVVREVARVEPHVVAPLGFDLVHGTVGALDQQGRIGAVFGRKRDADARRQEMGPVLQDERPFDRGQHPAGQRLHTFAVVFVIEQQDEFVAADASGDVVRTDRFLEAPGDFDEDLVADLMAQGVVDDLVPVQVDIEHAGRLLRRESLLQLLGQVDPVGQTGQRVVQGCVDQALFSRFALQVQRQGPREDIRHLRQEPVGAEAHRRKEQQRRQHVLLFIRNRREERRLHAGGLRLVALGKRRVQCHVAHPDRLAFPGFRFDRVRPDRDLLGKFTEHPGDRRAVPIAHAPSGRSCRGSVPGGRRPTSSSSATPQ